MSEAPQLVWNIEAELGEGPVWVERDRALWFTDIKRRKVHRFDPSSGEKRSWESPEQVGFVLPARSGGFIAGLQSGLFRFHPESGRFDLLAEVEPEKPANRLNDGVVDPAGRIWFGSMDNGEREKSGAFYVYADGEVRKTRLSGIAITNGPAVSPDGQILYWVDTLAGTICASSVPDGGELGEPRLLVRIDPAEGHPDGPTVDREGAIWIALYAGWEARRYSPAGELLDRVRFPVANITKLSFGGPDLTIGYATTARQHLKPEALARQPLAGGLFEFRATVPGIASPLASV